MKRIFQILFPLIALSLLGFVWSVPIQNAGGWASFWQTSDLGQFYYRIFQLAGLTAFSLVSFQVLTGPYMKLWERLYGSRFYRFHAWEGLTALLLAICHPLLLAVSLGLSRTDYSQFVSAFPRTFYFGPAALLLLLVTVPSAAATILWQKPTYARWWHWLHLANYLVFIFVFIHSLTIGSDLANPLSKLRPLWWLFFAGMLIGLSYRRIYRVITERTSGLDS